MAAIPAGRPRTGTSSTPSAAPHQAAISLEKVFYCQSARRHGATNPIKSFRHRSSAAIITSTAISGNRLSSAASAVSHHSLKTLRAYRDERCATRLARPCRLWSSTADWRKPRASGTALTSRTICCDPIPITMGLSQFARLRTSPPLRRMASTSPPAIWRNRLSSSFRLGAAATGLASASPAIPRANKASNETLTSLRAVGNRMVDWPVKQSQLSENSGRQMEGRGNSVFEDLSVDPRCLQCPLPGTGRPAVLQNRANAMGDAPRVSAA